MRVATLTTCNENGCGLEVGTHKGCPYNGFVGAYFRTNRSCRFSLTSPIMKMGAGPEVGNHKGCPYNGFVGAYFRTNRSCRFSLTSPIMKMGRGGSRTAPTGGYFQGKG